LQTLPGRFTGLDERDATMSTRTVLYRLARLLGDIQAIRRGKFPQRLIRKAMLRGTGTSV